MRRLGGFYKACGIVIGDDFLGHADAGTTDDDGQVLNVDEGARGRLIATGENLGAVASSDRPAPSSEDR